ncbi:MAG: hypothetical protein HY855_15760 [Burkholderiales bacterium]|nr:hypothetical protein [Burkholderiales bacterium]
MHRRQLLSFGVAGLMALPCVHVQASEPEHQPSAVVADSALGGGRSGAAFFFVSEVNGTPLARNILVASRAASVGHGADLQVRPFARALPAGRSTIKLAARFAYAAPIQTLFQAGADYAVEGVVEVELRPGTRYRVTGVLDAFRREVWLVEDATDKRVGSKVVDPAPAMDESASRLGEGFTCCNLHYEGDWISDANWKGLPFIPAGSRIFLKGFGRHRAEVIIEGRSMRVGLDYGRERETREGFVAKIMAKEDPKLRLASFSPGVQEAIRSAKVMIGMTREQVIMSMGFPRTDLNKSLDEPDWTYHTQDEQEKIVLVWGPDQRLKDVEAPPSLKRRLVHVE